MSSEIFTLEEGVQYILKDSTLNQDSDGPNDVR